MCTRAANLKRMHRGSDSIKLEQITPRGSPATIAFDFLQDTFGAGNAFAYTLVIEPPEGQTIMTEKFFVDTDAAIQKIVQGVGRPYGEVGSTWPKVQAAGVMVPPNLLPPAPAPPPSGACPKQHPALRATCGGLKAQLNRTACEGAGCCYNATPALSLHCFGRAPPPPPTTGGGGALMWGVVETWQQCKQHPKLPGCGVVMSTLGPQLDYLFDRFVSADRRATYVAVQLSLDPFSPTGQDCASHPCRHPVSL